MHNSGQYIYQDLFFERCANIFEFSFPPFDGVFFSLSFDEGGG